MVRLATSYDSRQGSSFVPDTGSSLTLGLFDIMQIDPLAGHDLAAMYVQRLDDLAYAESVGFDVAFVAERHFLPNFAAASATAWLGAASQRTSRIRLGAMAYTLPIKAPAQLAEDIATLDLLSGGRIEIGFGIGHRVEELVALGIDPAQRIPIFQERLALIRGLLTGGQVSYERGDVRLQGVSTLPLPMQEPHPPLWYAGTEPTAAQWMGENGLGLALGFKPTANLVPAAAAFTTGRSGASPEALTPRPAGSLALMRSVIVGESDDEVREQVIGDLLRIGDLNGEEGALDNRRARANAQFDQMNASEIMIAGGVDTVATAIRRQREQLRFDTFLASVHAMGMSSERVRTTLRLFAGPVRERLG